jgi:hypothetical protein
MLQGILWNISARLEVIAGYQKDGKIAITFGVDAVLMCRSRVRLMTVMVILRFRFAGELSETGARP